MSMKVGDLYAEMSIDDSNFNSSLDSIQGSMRNVGQNMQKLGGNMTKMITGPMAALGGAILENARRTGNYADEILDLSAATGMSTESLQEYRAVADRAGTSSDAVANAQQKLVRQMGRGEEGSASLRRGLDELGLSMEDIEDASPDEQMEILMERLNDVEDEGERARIGNQVLKGSYEELAPVLDMSAEQMEEVTEQARESGEVMDGDSLDAANQFREGLDELRSEFTGLMRNIAVDFMPVLTEELIPAVRESVVPIMRGLADTIGNLIEWFGGLSQTTQQVIVVITGLIAALGPVLVVTGSLISAMVTLAPILGTIAGAFGAISAPVVAAVSGVAAFAATAYLVYDNWTEVRDALSAIWVYMGVKINSFVTGSQKAFYGLQSTVLEVVNNILDRLGRLEDLPFGVGEKFEGMRDSISESADESQEKIQELEEQSEKNAEQIEQASDDMSASFGEAGSAIGDTVDGVTDKINIFSGETEQSADVAEDAGEEYIEAGEAAQEQGENIEESTESTKENTEGTEKNTESTEENTETKEENAEAEEELSESKEQEIARRERLEDRYSNKLREATTTRVEQLEHEKEQALENAEELGANKQDIIDYYDMEIEEAREERRERERENLEEQLTTKEEMRQDFNESIQQNASNTFEMMLDDLEVFEDTFIERNKYMNEFVTGVWNDMTASIGSALAQNLSEIGSWVTSTVAQLGKAAAAYIKTAYSALVSFFSWAGPAAPALAAGVIGTATAGIAKIGADAIGLEEGGLVTDRTFAEIGEGSDQEAVIPLNSSVFGQLGEGIVANMPGGRSSSGGNKTANITVELDGRTIAKATKQPLVDELRIKGVKV